MSILVEQLCYKAALTSILAVSLAGCSTMKQIGDASTAKGTSVKNESVDFIRTVSGAVLNYGMNLIDAPEEDEDEDEQMTFDTDRFLSSE